MKITIDLNDPYLQKQLESQINAKLQELIATTMQERIDHIVATKMGRITDVWIESTLRDEIRGRVQEACKTDWKGDSEFRKVLTEIAERTLIRTYQKP